jgi:elongation factor 1-gamma
MCHCATSLLQIQAIFHCNYLAAKFAQLNPKKQKETKPAKEQKKKETPKKEKPKKEKKVKEEDEDDDIPKEPKNNPLAGLPQT